MGKKSTAQINRMKRRAAARGEEYHEPPESVESKKKARMLPAAVELRKQLHSIEQNETLKAKDRRSAKRKAEAIASEEAGCPVEELLEWFDQEQEKIGSDTKKVDERKLAAAEKLQEELNSIEINKELISKDRRSAKRKAESIAAEEAGCPVADLLEWYHQHKDSGKKDASADTAEKGKENAASATSSFNNPYIVFVGQMAYTTSREDLFKHFQRKLGEEHTVTEETLRIRLLTDPKTQKSRGMAFLETTDPEVLYACLKLHHTHLDGRRINVERSAGGKRNSNTRQSKISQYRKEQEQHMSETVDKMLADYKSSGDLDENELDEGVVALCKRHSATTVEAALREYVEARGRDMENPSAYLSFIIGRIATDGVMEQKVDKFGKKKGRGAGGNRQSSRTGEQGKKRYVSNDGNDSSHGVMGSKLRKQSEFSKAGVDMSISNASDGAGSNLSTVFPSISRGRGRGRGYM